jgi:hypothetical protein
MTRSMPTVWMPRCAPHGGCQQHPRRIGRSSFLTTIGAKSGLAVASAGGALKNPSWYANLIAHPDVLVQDRGR